MTALDRFERELPDGLESLAAPQRPTTSPTSSG